MSQVVQLEKQGVDSPANSGEANTWILELPDDVCRLEGYPVGTMVSLTIKNGGVQTSIIQPSAEVDHFIAKVVDEEKEYFAEIKKIGD